jgi:hypothetical protein
MRCSVKSEEGVQVKKCTDYLTLQTQYEEVPHNTLNNHANAGQNLGQKSSDPARQVSFWVL